MADFDTKIMYAFERYLKVQKSGEINMVSSEVQKKAGISKEEHEFIMKNYAKLKEEFDKLKVVDELIDEAKKRVNGAGEPEKAMGFNKESPETET